MKSFLGSSFYDTGYRNLGTDEEEPRGALRTRTSTVAAELDPEGTRSDPESRVAPANYLGGRRAWFSDNETRGGGHSYRQSRHRRRGGQGRRQQHVAQVSRVAEVAPAPPAAHVPPAPPAAPRPPAPSAAPRPPAPPAAPRPAPPAAPRPPAPSAAPRPPAPPAAPRLPAPPAAPRPPAPPAAPRPPVAQAAQGAPAPPAAQGPSAPSDAGVQSAPSGAVGPPAPPDAEDPPVPPAAHISPASLAAQNPPVLVRARRRFRTVFSALQLQELETIFEENQYPDLFARVLIAEHLNLVEATVQVWFQNRRAKWKRQQREMMYRNLIAVPRDPSMEDTFDGPYATIPTLEPTIRWGPRMSCQFVTPGPHLTPIPPQPQMPLPPPLPVPPAAAAAVDAVWASTVSGSFPSPTTEIEPSEYFF
ncbi:homeobox protein ESX1 [Saccopteryx leptura]|uniref:homeobox protein ESX1 n=1 Tax=Saccopteryx leptura TaxID=249018 RepID=UPI00339BDF36